MKRFSLCLVLVAGCGAGEASSSGSDAADPMPAAAAPDESAIQGGAVDAKDPAVGMVWIAGGGFCSGALIAPNVVLTAGHCVESRVAAFYTGKGAGVSQVGPKPGSGFVAHKVVEQIAHPSYQSIDACPNPTSDVALLRLQKPIKSVTPLPIATAAPRVGAVCTAIGYGVHDAGQAETVEQKRDASETVKGSDATSVHVARKSGIVDHGDSGGPLVCAGHIAGVTSCGQNGPHSEAWYGRVDDVADWIDETVAGWQQ